MRICIFVGYKVLLVLCVMLILLWHCLPVAPVWRKNYSSGDYAYLLMEDGSACIAEYSGNAERLTLPDALDVHSMTAIRDGAFSWRFSLTQITLPNSAIPISDRAFSGCKSLTLTVGWNSYARDYAKANGIPCAYPDSLDGLNSWVQS